MSNEMKALPPAGGGQPTGIEKQSQGLIRRAINFFFGKKVSVGTKTPALGKTDVVGAAILKGQVGPSASPTLVGPSEDALKHAEEERRPPIISDHPPTAKRAREGLFKRPEIEEACRTGRLSEKTIPEEPLMLAKDACYAYQYVKAHPTDENAKKVLVRLYVELEDRQLINKFVVLEGRWSAAEVEVFRHLYSDMQGQGEEIEAAREKKRALEFRTKVLGQSYLYVKSKIEEIDKSIADLEKESTRKESIISELRQIRTQLVAYTNAVEEKIPEEKSRKATDKDAMEPFRQATNLGGESGADGVGLLKVLDNSMKEIIESVKRLHPLIKKEVTDKKQQSALLNVSLMIPLGLGLIESEALLKHPEKFPNAHEARSIAQSTKDKVGDFDKLAHDLGWK